MRIPRSLWGWVAALAVVSSLVGSLFIFGSSLFSPGPLSAEHPQDRPSGEWTTHAEFESHCELCHAPFRGPESARCIECHRNVGDQMINGSGVHRPLLAAPDCAACHTDHKGRTATLDRAFLTKVSHDQLGFSLARHQRDYEGAPITCRSCHLLSTQTHAEEAVALVSACTGCHQREDARFVTDHRQANGDACLACHNGADHLAGFDHATTYPLDGKHVGIACDRCHFGLRSYDKPRACVECHPAPDSHVGQYGEACVVCHSAAGWRPAVLGRHTFPVTHGGKPSACQVCHPARYVAYTCYNCHAHEPPQIERVHADKNIRDLQECTQCHPTGE